MIPACLAAASAYPKAASEGSDATSEGLEPISAYSDNATEHPDATMEYPDEAPEGCDTLLYRVAKALDCRCRLRFLSDFRRIRGYYAWTGARVMKTIYLWRPLSPRLKQVLQLIGRGSTDQKAAERLGITLGTLRTYLAQLRIVLPVSSLEGVRRLARDWSARKIRIYAEIRDERL